MQCLCIHPTVKVMCSVVVRLQQRVQKLKNNFVPSCWVVKVTGMAGPLHYHYLVIRQILQVV